LNKNVDIVSYGNDRYGRTLGVVYVDGKNVNLEMIKVGFAEVYRGKTAPGFDNEPYQKAEVEARGAGMGMWSLGDKYVSPRDWRKTH
jgi:endonuclease YncB( thermonuclease family)